MIAQRFSDFDSCYRRPNSISLSNTLSPVSARQFAFPTPVDGSAADQDASAAAEASQVTEIPAGAAETGVPVKADSSPAGTVGLSVLALGALAGSGLLVRRAVKA